jgi:monoterpene epsilon-lactone hydrolase
MIQRNAAVTNPTKPRFTETRHALTVEDSSGVQAYFARRQKFAASFSGSPAEGYDLMCAETPIADGVTLEEVEQGDVQGWWIRPANALPGRAILFLHGGGYMFGTATAYRGFASQIAVRGNVAVFSADYPLSSEHPFPAAYQTALALRHWLYREGMTQIALVGDSAGGGLALATLGETMAESPRIAAAVVYSPWLDLALTGAAFSNPDTNDPVFKRDAFGFIAAKYVGEADAKDPRISPLYGIPEHLPPIAIQVGTEEFLLDDSLRYAELAAKQGGVVQLDVFEGLHHVFQRCVADLSRARQAFDLTAQFISAHWR